MITASEDPADKDSYSVHVHDLDNVLSTVLSLDGREIEIKAAGVDEAMHYAEESKDFDLDPEIEKKLVRKIDWMILPLMVALMSCQLMDKTTNSYAALMGLKTSLNMSAEAYSWVGSSFYFGFLIFEYPANNLLQRYKLNKTLSLAVLIWGVVLMCHAACSNSAGFLVCRVLLGCCEGFMNPAYIMLTTQWYKKEEQFMKTSIWFGFQGFGTLLGAGIAHGLYVYRVGDHAFDSWRLIYIITGIITIFFGVVSFFHIPDIPVKAWFLNETEKKYCVERIRGNQQGFGSHQVKKEQAFEAVKDPTTWIYFVYGISYAIPNGGFTNFGSILMNEDFGFDAGTSLLMNMPGGAIDIVWPPIVALIDSYIFKKTRLISMCCVNVVCIVGMALLAFAPPKGARLAGYYSFYLATVCIAGMMSLVSSNVAGRTKKATVSAIFFVGYCVGNIIGPQTYQAKDAPSYTPAKIGMLVGFAVGTCCMISLLAIYRFRNKQRDEKRAALGENYKVPDNLAFADLTDLENPEFRYSL